MVGKAKAALKPETSASAHPFSGRHFLASYLECNPEALENPAGLRECLRNAIKASGATLLGLNEHIFPAGGMTIVALLAESHASIHTYPEHRACFVDFFTCGSKTSIEDFDAVIRAYLQPGEVAAQTEMRGQAQ